MSNNSETKATGQCLYRKIKDFTGFRLKFSFYYNDVPVSLYGGTERMGEICEIFKRKWGKLSKLVKIREDYDNPPLSIGLKEVRVFDSSLVGLVHEALKDPSWIVREQSNHS